MRVSTPSEEVRGNCAIARPHSRLARGAMVPDALSFSVSPMSGPSRGGTSLGVRLVSSEGAGASLSTAVAIATTTLHIGDVALNCTESGDSSLRCCCTPRAANLSACPDCVPQAPLVLYGASPTPAAFEFAHAPMEFAYYADPTLLRISPVRGDVRGETVTISAIGWPSMGSAAADAPRCRFGTAPPVPAKVQTAAVGAAAGSRVATRIVCTSPDLGAGGPSEGAVAVAVAPNGFDFPPTSAAPVLFHYAPVSRAHVLLAGGVFLGVLLLLRAYASAAARLRHAASRAPPDPPGPEQRPLSNTHPPAACVSASQASDGPSSPRGTWSRLLRTCPSLCRGMCSSAAGMARSRRVSRMVRAICENAQESDIGMLLNKYGMIWLQAGHRARRLLSVTLSLDSVSAADERAHPTPFTPDT